MAPMGTKKSVKYAAWETIKKLILGDVAEVLNSRYQKPIEKFRRTNATH